MNSLKIQSIALSMVILLAASQTFGSETPTAVVVPGDQETVVRFIEPTLTSKAVQHFNQDATVRTAKNIATQTKNTVVDASKSVYRNVVSPSTLFGNIKRHAINLKDATKNAVVSTARTMNNNRVSTLLGTAATAATIYGGYKLNNARVESNNQKLARIDEILLSNEVDFNELSELINGLWMLPSTKKQVRAYVDQALQNRNQLPVAKNTMVEEVKDAAKSVVQAGKDVVNTAAAKSTEVAKEAKTAVKLTVRQVVSKFRQGALTAKQAIELLKNMPIRSNMNSVLKFAGLMDSHGKLVAPAA